MRGPLIQSHGICRLPQSPLALHWSPNPASLYWPCYFLPEASLIQLVCAGQVPLSILEEWFMSNEGGISPKRQSNVRHQLLPSVIKASCLETDAWRSRHGISVDIGIDVQIPLHGDVEHSKEWCGQRYAD